MQLSPSQSILDRAAFRPLAQAVGAGGPVREANPEVDPLVDQQARFRIEGSGPLAERRIVPVTAGARELLAASDRVPDAVRGVLRLVEHAAGGARASEQLVVNGVAFANSPAGHGANTYRAHMDDDGIFAAGMARAGGAQRRDAVLRLGRETAAESLHTKANVVAGWLNLGPTASGALLARTGVVIPGYNDRIGEPELAHAVRVLRHEAQHLADQSEPRLEAGGALGLREALAESNSRTLEQLRPARRLLGLDGAVSDQALQRSTAVQPYAAAERLLAGALTLSGIDPHGSDAVRLLARPSDEVAETLVGRLAERTGTGTSQARTDLGAEFARALGRPVAGPS